MNVLGDRAGIDLNHVLSCNVFAKRTLDSYVPMLSRLPIHIAFTVKARFVTTFCGLLGAKC